MESSNVTILGSGNPTTQGSLDESRLPGAVCSSRMLIGPTGSTGIIQSCEVVGISGNLTGAGFLSPTTTAQSLDCTLKCSVTVAVPSHPGTASFRGVSSAESSKGTAQQQIEGLLGHRKFSSGATYFGSPCRNTDDDKEDDDIDDDEDEEEEDSATFDSFELQNNDDDEEQDQVPIGEILEKLQAGSSPGYPGSSGRNGSGNSSNIIRLHAAHDDSETPTISATVNVAALDLSDPDSIYRHLSQLNDTVLRVSAKNSDSLSDSGRQTPVNFMDSPPVHARDVLTPTPIHSPRSPSPSMPTMTDSSALSSSACLKIETNLNKPPYLPASIQLPTSPLALATSCPTPSPSALCSPSLQSVSSSSTPCSETSPVLMQGKTSSCVGSSNSSSCLGKSTPQSCAICCKVFSNASALAKHRLTHSEERRYHCSICSKAFKRQDHLNGHLLTHRSTKPFACHVDGCGKSYCDARSLRRHKENHHSGVLKQQQLQQQQQHHTIVTLPTLTSLPTPTPVPTPTLTLTPKIVEAVPAEPLISRSSLGDTKIMFSSKGLTAQQLQLIEQLLKESRNGKLVSMPTAQSFTAMPSTSFTLPTVPISSGNSVTTSTTTRLSPSCIGKRMQPVAEKLTACSPVMSLGDKPVECTICNRKFKNIPALNGHMRLHGGYYKKDSDGKRIPLTTNLKQNNLKLSKFSAMAPKSVAKRKCPSIDQPTFVPEKKSSLCPISVQSSLSSLQPVTSAMFSIISSGPKSTMSPSLNLNTSPHFEPSKPVSICPPPPVPQPSLAFQSLPPPDTNKLLENLEKKNFGMVSMKTDTYETCYKEKPKPVLHLSKGVGVKETGNRMGNFVTTFGLPAISLPTKPIPQLQLEETSNLQHLKRPNANLNLPPGPPAVDIKPEPILPSDTLEKKEDIKEEIPIPDSISFPNCSFSNPDDQSDAPMAGSGSVGSNLLTSNSSSGLSQFLTSSGLSCGSKSHQHQMLKVDLESDKTPKVGEEFQADVPDCQAIRGTPDHMDDCLDTLLWNPDALLDDVDIDDYLMLASSCAVHLGSHNEELALELLQKHDGNLTDAVQELLASPDDDDDEDADNDVGSHQPDDDSESSDMEEDDDEDDESSGLLESQSHPWTELEVNAFYEGLVKHKKDFVKISQQIGTRSVQECVDFYYIWKNFCHDESNSFKSIFFSQCSKVNSQDPSGRDFVNNNNSNSSNNNNPSLQGHDPASTSLE